MKAILAPLYFNSAVDEGFASQLATITQLLAGVAVFTEPVRAGESLPDCDAVVFPQLVGAAFKQMDRLLALGKPLLVLTSEFCTVAMWDWELVSLLKARGAVVFTPYTMDQAVLICRAFGARRRLAGARFLMFQDNPGEGMQAEIFKRFYWWEDECTAVMKKRFGLTIVKRSYRKLASDARAYSDAQADAVIREKQLDGGALQAKALRSAVKLYLAIKAELAGDQDIVGAGINCLNESMYSDTTPCLAWDLLYRERGLLWACEADTLSLLTQYLMHETLGGPIMMSNVYPFLMGQAALKHEKIAAFPEIDQPENHVLVAHCGYFGLLSSAHACQWKLTPKVLSIVADTAHAVDGRLPEGPLTLAKLDPLMETLQIIPAELESYAGYPGSDCRNGAILRVPDGHQLMDKLYSHHQCFTTGRRARDLALVAKAFGLKADTLAGAQT